MGRACSSAKTLRRDLTTIAKLGLSTKNSLASLLEEEVLYFENRSKTPELQSDSVTLPLLNPDLYETSVCLVLSESQQGNRLADGLYWDNFGPRRCRGSK